MIRMDVRYEVNLPVEITTKEIRERSFRAVVRDFDLYGAELKERLDIPDNFHTNVRIALPDGEVVVEGRVDVKEDGVMRLQFLKMDPEARIRLWNYLKKRVEETRSCPYCKSGLRPRQERCDNCGLFVDVENERYLEISHNDLVSLRVLMLEEAVDMFNREMDEIERFYASRRENERELVKEVTAAIHRVCDVCRDLEDVAGIRTDLVKSKQEWLRKETDPYFSLSYFCNHARTWPRGYPGDYEVLEGIYRSVPLSSGIGYLLDLFFLNTTLAVAVKERLVTLREMLRSELVKRDKPRVLDIACGSCREVFELAPEIGSSGAEFICIDFDSDSLSFSGDRLSYTTILNQISFRRYNAIRMVNHERNEREFGHQDIIYSTGLFDYLTDDVLVKMIRALYELANPGGKIISSFKDCNRYRTQIYHWFAKWDAFYQRTEKDCLRLFEEADIPMDELSVMRERSGVIMFFIVEKR